LYSGGVGGYFMDYCESLCRIRSIEIVFIARGETKKAIAESGLTIITDENEITVFQIFLDDPLTIKLDYLICAHKNI
jgi:2-dehydropantoate 2-reductase